MEFVMHIDENIIDIVGNSKIWAYLILAAIVFCETGLFMAPFLPEESLLFVVGTVAASGAMDIGLITIILVCVNLIGETVNYFIGFYFGPKIFNSSNSILFNKKHIKKAFEFYECHGAKTIIMGKYIPLIRTFIPFVSGMIKVNYKEFILFNMLGGIPWVCLFIGMGYFFGNLPIVSENFLLVIGIIVIISISPGIVSVIRKRLQK